MTTPNPGAPLGMSDFFVLEAGEYLERLDAQLQAPEGTAPAPDEFVRLARALRGSALMASHQAIARAASGLEALARAVREARRPWDAATRQIAIRAVDDLKIFVRRATSWTEADTAKAEALGSQLEQLGGRPSAQIRAAEVLGLDAGARAFVAREGAAIASALDRAAQALRTNPLAHDPLQHVLRALQPLRGLAALSDLPPLPDLLEGIERTIGEFGRPGVPPRETGELFQAAAGAIAKAARQVAERGRPDPEAPEFQAFAARLVRLEDAAPEVVPIASLYYADSGPHVVRRGTPPARPATLGRLELVSHGEHLRQAADSLERAPSATQRELRAHTLAGTFRALASAGGGPLADRVAEFARAARDALTAGLAVQNAVAFAAELRKAGDLLARSSSEDEEGLAAQLAEHTRAVQGLARSGAAPAAPVVPIESLAPTAATGPAPRLPVGDDAIPPETPDIVGSWVTYRRLVAAGVGPASTEALLGPGAAGPPVVDIRTLLYSGVRAQQRAQELRVEAKHATGEQLRALVEEVCDLVALALESPPPPSPPAPSPRRASRWAWVVGLAVTGAFLAWAVRGTHWSEVRAGLSAVDPVLLFVAIALATLTFPLRTIRWRVMLRNSDDRGTPFPWPPLWHAVAIGFMANNLLPARAGEFARAYVASRQLPVRFTTALASIGVERVFDALVMLALMAVAIAAPSFPAHTTLLGAPLSRLAGRTAVLFGAMFVVAFAVVLRPAPWLALFERAVRAVFPPRLAERLAGIAEGLVAGLEVLKRPGRFAAVLFWSLVLWLTNAASFAVCFRAFGLHLPLEGSLLLQGILGFAVALPASAGFFGVFEKGAQLTLQIYGISPSLALAYAVAYHLSTFLPITLLGLSSLSRVRLHLRDLRRVPAADTVAPGGAEL